MHKCRVIIAGGRDFNNYGLLFSKVFRLLGNLKPSDIQIVTGGATGADALGKRYAEEIGLSHKEFPADWNEHGKAAGPIRNQQMARYATHLIAFHDGKSRGTLDMIDLAGKAGLNVRVVKY